MTGDDLDPSFDDPSYDDIRALLRDSRETGPLPDYVAARLDSTLAELRGNAPEPAAPVADVVPLRRRVSRPRLLVAAAAVIIVGAGGSGIAITLANQKSDVPASATSVPAGGASRHSPMAPQVKGLAPIPSSPGPHVLNGQLDALAAQPVGAFTTADFASQAAAYAQTANLTYATAEGNVNGTSSGSSPGSNSGSGGGASTAGGASAGTGSGTVGSPAQASPPVPGALPPVASSKSLAPCVAPNVPGAQLVPITLDGNRATLVLHPASHGKQLVEAWSCDGTRVLASATVPA